MDINEISKIIKDGKNIIESSTNCSIKFIKDKSEIPKDAVEVTISEEEIQKIFDEVRRRQEREQKRWQEYLDKIEADKKYFEELKQRRKDIEKFMDDYNKNKITTCCHVGDWFGWEVALDKDKERIIMCLADKESLIKMAKDLEQKGYEYKWSCENYMTPNNRLSRNNDWYNKEIRNETI